MTDSGPAEHWVFGYGSLMWRPDFPFLERHRATIYGHHRAFCIKSTHYRGTPDRPGLVLGLDQGRSCTGVAFRIAGAQAAGVVAYLRRRELIYGVYREAHVAAEIDIGEAAGATRTVRALAFIAERHHPAYAGGLAPSRQAAIIRGARGISGNNLDYLINTMLHLSELGIRERELERLVSFAGSLAARGRTETPARASTRALYNICRSRDGGLDPVSRGDQRRFGHRARLSRGW